MQSMTQQFKDWVAQQDPAREYDFLSMSQCALAQFAIATTGVLDLTEASTEIHDLHTVFLDPLGDHPRTFGALSSRLEGVS